MGMRFSVIIPQRGQSEMTRRCAESLLTHHADMLELVIVDDGSDASERKALCRLGDRALIVPQLRRRGVTAAWNAGARAAPLANGARMTGVEWRREPDLPASLAQAGGRLLPGWCVALGAETWRRVGGFDERFQLYFSDTDLQCRLLASAGGAALAAVPGLPVRHLGHRSARLLPGRRNAWRADRERFLRKWQRAAPAAGTH